MIELKWVREGGAQLLFYRTWKVRIDASGAITPLPLPIEWTEWKMVPVELGNFENLKKKNFRRRGSSPPRSGGDDI